MTGLLGHELRLLLRQRIAVPTLVLVLFLSAAAVWAGMAEVARQHDIIARIKPQQVEDVKAIRAWVSKDGDAGNAAYYTFHATWDAPLPRSDSAMWRRLLCASAHWRSKVRSTRARIITRKWRCRVVSIGPSY